MSDFAVYLELGFTHITDLAGYDHMLFLLALCAAYQLPQWRQVLLLVTAFTFGHSASLALNILGESLLPSDIIEFLIPVTIALTCVYNIFMSSRSKPSKMGFNYGLALIFGLVHGMGFSNYLRMLLGSEESIFKPLFAFNIGLELGQILIVSFILGVSAIILRFLPITQTAWTIALSMFAGGIAIYLAWNTWPA